ncbi:helix-turn-helix domain-containing protein [Streptomyces sp. NPDC006704]|uniref:helix-turn-helix domain-containing protein n=1 Tax=Streptomyces sp. NPDC006704 TaxID=3364760 RepID=UPI0036B0C621
MDVQNPSAPPRTQSRTRGKNHPQRRPHAGGVIHDNTRHTTRFTVIGNHLAQHTELSGLAIGLAVYIQSLPTGAPADIKTLAARFPEGSTRIAAALRELEAHGYLRRTRERVPGGRIITRTVSCNQPGAPRQDAAPAVRRAAPGKPPPRKLLPAVPRPAQPSPSLLQTATDLLAGLRRQNPLLLLSATDTEHLAPGVVAWLEREVTPVDLRRALTRDLPPPDDLRRPAALLAHRLAALLPPPPPATEPRPHPLQTCESCDRAFRAPEPGPCGGCRPDHQGGT